MAPVKIFRHQTAFIRLQRPDEMPGQRRLMPGKVSNLIDAFLNIVFAKRQLPGSDSFFDRARRFCFADCKQRNFF